MYHIKPKIPYIILAIIFFLSDQISKKVIVSIFKLYNPISVIPHFFTIIYVHNRGFIFGVLSRSGDSFVPIIIFILSIASLIFITLYFFVSKDESKLFSYGFSFVIGGALGNLHDRLRYGLVVDFLDFYIGKYHWPTFNLADTFICTGILLLVIDVLRINNERKATPQRSDI